MCVEGTNSNVFNIVQLEKGLYEIITLWNSCDTCHQLFIHYEHNQYLKSKGNL